MTQPRLLRSPTRDVRTRIIDSARWAAYVPRSDDIVIATYPKCGTTWTQRIVAMLVFGSAAPQSLWDISLWPDMRLEGPIEATIAKAEAQTHRRFFKTHLPLDALPIYAGVKILHVARDGRDAAMSFHNHLAFMRAESAEPMLAVSRNDPKFGDDPPPVPEDPARFFTDWVNDGGAHGDDGASFYHVENSYWSMRHHPDLLLVHYNDLKADREGEMRRIARFLGIDVAESRWPEFVQAAGFEAMKAQGDELIPAASVLWDKGPQRFLNQGTNGRWRGVVAQVDLDRYGEQVARHFEPALATWLELGRLGAGDPTPR